MPVKRPSGPRPWGLALLGLQGLWGCSRGAQSPDASELVSVPGDAGAAAVDAPGAVDAGPPDTGPRFTPPRQIIALSGWTPVRREPRRDARAAGYLRAGAVVNVIDGPHGRDGCVVHRDHPEGGWYRVEGGYLCEGGASAVPFPNRGFRAPTQADLDASMPYAYAINYGRTIMYRRLPTNEDLRQFEPWRFNQRTDGGAESADTGASAAEPTGSSEQGGEAQASARRPARQPEVRDAGVIRLSDLAGERRGPMIRRLLSGMYVALDRTLRNTATGESYWRTQSGGFVRSGRLSALRSWPTFQGVVLDATRTLPYAWMVSESGMLYSVAPNERSVSYHRRIGRLEGVQLADREPIRLGAQTYYPTPDGHAVNARSARRAALRTPPAGVGPNERWFDVDLDEQVLVAYEGPRPVYATLISSGRRTSPSAAERFETPEGTFRVYAKHVTTTMDGDTATDGPYSIEDVPWVMYFEGSYALHGAFWHNYFGWRMSHGCVNLAPADARHVFLWADPQLPQGWHGIYAGEGAPTPGSRVVLRHSRANAREEGRPTGAARAVPLATDQ
ncbi:MAG: L,D-transpeptidase [Myxococcales bacterium]|nr:L,D-transpeptidase [Myxococcales bacterium]